MLHAGCWLHHRQIAKAMDHVQNAVTAQERGKGMYAAQLATADASSHIKAYSCTIAWKHNQLASLELQWLPTTGSALSPLSSAEAARMQFSEMLHECEDRPEFMSSPMPCMTVSMQRVPTCQLPCIARSAAKLRTPAT